MKRLLLGILVSFLWPEITVAQEDQTREAKATFRAATGLFKAERFEEAAQEFRRAYSLKPSYKIYYNIGQSEAAASRHGAALEAFEKYLSMGGDKIEQARQREVRDEIRRLREMTGIVEVIGPEGMVISVDGTVRGTYPTIRRVSVSAGVIHSISGTVGDTTDEKEIQVLGGDTVTIHLEPGKEAPEADIHGADSQEMDNQGIASEEDAVAPISDAAGKQTPFVVGLSLIGVGGVALAGGAICGGLALNKESLLQRRCKDNVCTEEERPIEESRDRLAIANVALLAAGGVAAAAGMVLTLVSRLKKKERRVMWMPTKDGLIVSGSF